MKIKTAKEIRELGYKSYIKVVDLTNNDILGRFKNLVDARKTINRYIDDCDGDCQLAYVKYENFSGNYYPTKTYERYFSEWVLVAEL